MGFLTGKTVIITGGGRAVLANGKAGAIGYGIATAYAKEGANIVITGRNIKKLEDAKAVTSYKEQYYTMYSLCKDVFMTNIIDIINEESEIIDEQKQREDAYREKVIKAFFEYGKLKSIPSQRKKERIW